ncbi:MAG: riboflavin synthase, partial [Elusimicrobiota bacterium]
MFQGIIEHTATVIKHTPSNLVLKLPITWRLKVGSSVAVNGTCLTVVKARPGCAYFDLNRETTSLTNLGNLQTGDPVNLELPIRLGDPISGHLVLGHVGGIAELSSIRK